jgi:hypothetical protein
MMFGSRQRGVSWRRINPDCGNFTFSALYSWKAEMCSRKFVTLMEL